jgi:MFS family permease
VTAKSDARQLFLVSTAMAFFVATQTMLALFVPLYAVALGATPAVVGGLVSLAFLLPLFLAMPVGSLVDKVGSRGLITLASATLAVVPLAVWAQPGLLALAFVQVVGGVAHLVLIVAAQRYVSNLGRGRSAERNFGWYATFQSGGQMVGPLLGGVVADVVGYQGAFLTVGALAGIALVLARLLRRSEASGEPRPLAPFGDRGQIGELLGNPGVRMAIAISCGVLVAQSVRQTFLPIYLEDLDYAATVIGLLMSLRAAMSMVVRPFMPAIVRGLGGRALTAAIMVTVLAFGLGMTAFVEALLPLAITSLLVGLGTGITQPLSIVTVTDHVPRDRVGFALGLRLTGNRLAQVVSPVVIGLVAEFAGVPWAFIASALTLVVTATIILRWRKPFDRAERAAAAKEALSTR